MRRPDVFPELPPLPPNANNTQFIEAYNIISSHYNSVSKLLREDESDPIRLRIHSERILHRVVPLLDALEKKLGNNEWILNVAKNLQDLVNEIDTVVAANNVS